MSFNQQSLKKIDAALQRAKIAIDNLQKTLDPEECYAYWETFLVQIGIVFNRIAAGARENRKLQPWWGRVRSIRDNDPLLLYLRHARNCAEHSIHETILDREYISLVATGQGSLNMTIDGGQIMANHPDVPIFTPSYPGSEFFFRRHREVRLKSVLDRNGSEFHPPTTHLGKPLSDTSPLGIAKLALEFLDGLVAEARSFK